MRGAKFKAIKDVTLITFSQRRDAVAERDEARRGSVADFQQSNSRYTFECGLAKSSPEPAQRVGDTHRVITP